MANANQSRTSISRRAAMFALPVIASIPAIKSLAAPVSPDAELIALCEEFIRLDVDLRTRIDGSSDEEGDRIYNDCRSMGQPLLDRFTAMPAQTIEGLRAKARALQQYCEGLPGSEGGWDGSMLSSLMRDLVGGAA